MNLEPDETQAQLRDLAAQVFARRTPPERLAQVEASADRFDRDLWRDLAQTGLLGVAVPEADGGLGLGAVGLALACEQLGRTVAPVPFAGTACVASVLGAAGGDEQRRSLLAALLSGDAVAAVAPEPSARGLRLAAGRLSGSLVGVPWAHVADVVLVAVGDEVVLVDPSADGVRATPGETTARTLALSLELTDVAVSGVGSGAGVHLRQSWSVALAAVQAGVTDTALRLAADYTSQREQFGRPLSTFQGVALKAADAYVDSRAIRAAALQAAWSLDEGLDATLPVLTAAWWAAEAGQHAVHLTQHLHGGTGADVTYPVHRYFLWGKQIELMLGGASAVLAALGDALAARPYAGDALVLDAD